MNKGKTYILFIVLTLIYFGLNSQRLYGQLAISPQITVKQEYDDNVNLTSGKTDSIKADFVTHVMPVIALKHLYKNHSFHIDLNGNYRRGFQSDLSNLNMNFAGGFSLNFNGGLNLYANNNYLTASFDQALYDEVGVYIRNSNTFSAGMSYIYSPVNRLMLDVNYRNKQDLFDNEDLKVNRIINYLQGRLSLPLSRSLLGYGDLQMEKQDSKERRSRNYLNNQIVGGLQWKGTARVTFYLEGGYGQITYDLPEMQDFKNAVGKVGMSVLFTESTTGQVMAGQDGYGNVVFDALFAYRYSERTSLSLTANKETRSSFSTLHKNGIIEYTAGQLQIIKTMFDKFVMVINGTYQLQESAAVNNNTRNLKHTVWLEYLSLSYNIQDWITAGMNGQYATRVSYLNLYDYNDSRIGVFIRLKK